MFLPSNHTHPPPQPHGPSAPVLPKDVLLVPLFTRAFSAFLHQATSWDQHRHHLLQEASRADPSLHLHAGLGGFSLPHHSTERVLSRYPSASLDHEFLECKDYYFVSIPHLNLVLRFLQQETDKYLCED